MTNMRRGRRRTILRVSSPVSRTARRGAARWRLLPIGNPLSDAESRRLAPPAPSLVMKGSPVRVRASATTKALETGPLLPAYGGDVRLVGQRRGHAAFRQ